VHQLDSLCDSRYYHQLWLRFHSQRKHRVTDRAEIQAPHPQADPVIRLPVDHRKVPAPCHQVHQVIRHPVDLQKVPVQHHRVIQASPRQENHQRILRAARAMNLVRHHLIHRVVIHQQHRAYLPAVHPVKLRVEVFTQVRLRRMYLLKVLHQVRCRRKNRVLHHLTIQVLRQAVIPANHRVAIQANHRVANQANHRVVIRATLPVNPPAMNPVPILAKHQAENQVVFQVVNQASHRVVTPV